jgi:hypothetical protein
MDDLVEYKPELLKRKDKEVDELITNITVENTTNELREMQKILKAQ